MPTTTFNILSIDGGGLRGIVPVRILQKLETITGKKVHELFDMMAGTSTGGLIASFLTLRDPANKKNPQYGLSTLSDVYTKEGGIIFPLVHYCRDSYTGMAFVLDRMAESGLRISELAAGLPCFHRRSGKLPFEHGRLGGMMQAVEAAFPGAQTDRSDGLKLSWPDRWIHLRASNTEPLVRLAVESKSAEQAEAIYATVLAAAR